MAMITAQDAKTAAHLSALGAEATVTGSLKPAAADLSCDPTELAQLRTQVADRFVWAVAPAHPDDIAHALAAHDRILRNDPSALLIIAPRFPDADIPVDGPRRSKGEVPHPGHPVWVCDTLGDMGLIYRLAQAALIGGAFSDIEGHNPWEAAALGCAILHGPRTAHFAADYAQLAAAGGAILVETTEDSALALTSTALPETAANATYAKDTASKQTDTLALDLLKLCEGIYG